MSQNYYILAPGKSIVYDDLSEAKTVAHWQGKRVVYLSEEAKNKPQFKPAGNYPAMPLAAALRIDPCPLCTTKYE